MINDLFNIKGKAIHCATKKLALKTLSILDSMGYKWVNGNSLLKSSLWEFFESNTYYRVGDNKSIAYGNISDIEPSNILKAEDFINLYKNNNNMQKSDFKSGMSVKLRNGEKGLIVDVNNIKIIQYVDDWDNLNTSYTTDLKYSNSNLTGYDIMEVYNISEYSCVRRDCLCKECNLIWRRVEKFKEITMQEIADKFGVSINDLRIKKD